jgi:hypothetical protein
MKRRGKIHDILSRRNRQYLSSDYKRRGGRRKAVLGCLLGISLEDAGTTSLPLHLVK